MCGANWQFPHTLPKILRRFPSLREGISLHQKYGTSSAVLCYSKSRTCIRFSRRRLANVPRRPTTTTQYPISNTQYPLPAGKGSMIVPKTREDYRPFPFALPDTRYLIPDTHFSGRGAVIVSHKNFVSHPTPSTTDHPIPTLHSLSEGSPTGEGACPEPVLEGPQRRVDNRFQGKKGIDTTRGSPITWNHGETMVEYQADPIRRHAP
jgi:hypothetical protein